MLRVLLIDDNLDDRTLVIRHLNQTFKEIEVQQIIDQASLDQALRVNDFEIAITDYQLIWTTGLKVLQQIKAACPACPVIMFTHSATQEEAIEAMKAGLDDYIVKSPRHYIRLASAVRLALERAADRHKAKQTEMRLEGLLNHLHVGVFRATLDGQLVEANPAFLQLLGVQTLAEAQALNLHELFLHPQVKSFDRTSLSPAAASAPVKQWLGREIQLRQAHGETVWVTLNQTITAVDRELFVEGLTEDISDRKALELALQQQAEALAHANRLKDEFLTTIYHELRTPLNTILGWAKILRAQPIPSVAMFNRALEVIERNAIKQANIIEDILDVSQIIQGQLRLNPTSVNLEKTLAAAIEGIRPAAEAKSITLNLHLASDLNFIWGDANRLQQILWNLLLNAVKFTPRAGQIEVRVELLKGEREKGKGEREKGKGKRRKAKGKRGMEKRLCRSHSPIHPSTHPPIPSYAQITITDTGIGISPEFLPYVFDRFSQADGSISRNYGGLGMGLAIVRHLVELHGGTVSAESPGMGQGATFTVRIPSISPQIPSTTLSAPD